MGMVWNKSQKISVFKIRCSRNENKMVRNWPESRFSDVHLWHTFLKSNVSECRTLSFISSTDFRPPGWTNGSIVKFAFDSKSLKNVPANSREDVEICISNSQNRSGVDEKLGAKSTCYNSGPEIIQNRRTNSYPLQRNVMNILALSCDCDWLKLLQDRLTLLCPGFIFDYHATSAGWIAKCQQLRLEHRNVALRSLCNGWPTSYTRTAGAPRHRPRPAGERAGEIYFSTHMYIWYIVFP